MLYLSVKHYRNNGVIQRITIDKQEGSYDVTTLLYKIAHSIVKGCEKKNKHKKEVDANNYFLIANNVFYCRRLSTVYDFNALQIHLFIYNLLRKTFKLNPL